MLTTEDLAKLKWCPLARTPNYLSSIGSTANRNINGLPIPSSLCIGSACMAWRESVYPEERTMKPEDRTPRVGYCGAFGRPE